jgi:hypothetical protein
MLRQVINVAVPEKIAALRTTDHFREHAQRDNMPAGFALLHCLGTDEAPRPSSQLK